MSGGYILAFNPPDSKTTQIDGYGNWETQLIVVYPQQVNLASEQLSYISDYIANFTDATLDRDWPRINSYMDLQSFINIFLHTELSANIDAFYKSAYFHKERNGLLKSGPVWDFDLSFVSLCRYFFTRVRETVIMVAGVLVGLINISTVKAKFQRSLPLHKLIK
jgi:hypothetical protein